MKKKAAADSLLSWFDLEKRTFPWREEKRDPYRVWISEIMLQQTRAEVVISYFEKWMRKYPSLLELSLANEEEVIKMWEGLGYYSRARNILITAKEIVASHGGKLPSTRDALLKLRGLGKYTSSAILAFAFQKSYLAVDGNVARVLSRYFAIERDIASEKTKEMLEELGLKAFGKEKMPIIAEALIELGALVCKKSALCHLCPLQATCTSYRRNLQEVLPIKKKSSPLERKNRAVFVFVWQKKVYLQKQEKGKVMADLYEFPYIELLAAPDSKEELLSLCRKFYSPHMERVCFPDSLKQTFTRFHYTLFPLLVFLNKPLHLAGFEEVGMEAAEHLPFSSAHRKLWGRIIKKVLL